MKVVLFRSLRGQPSMERFARALAAALAADGGLDCRPGLLPPADFPTAPFHWRKYVSYQLRAGRWGRAADVSHVVDHGYGHLVGSLPAGRALVTVHDMGPLWSGRARFAAREGGRRAALAYWYSVRAMRRAARIVAVSESARRDLLEYTGWPESRVRVIHSGVEARFRPPDPAEAARLAARLGLAGRRFLLHVGASSARKNLAAALRALALLDAEVLLVKAGAPLEAPERALAAELGLAGRVREIGGVEEADLPLLYAAAEALICPSLYEGFGWPPLEAMACGTPAVVSGIPALREIAGPGAVVVENPEDPGELAAAIRGCLRGSAGRAGLVARGLARAAEFTWAKAARAYAGLYREILAEAGG